MKNIISTIAVLLSVCANGQYKEMLHAYITPTNKVVTSVPDWVKSAADYYTFGFRKDGSLNGFLSFAHGTNVTASGKYSFASGSTTVASAEASHAEGNSTTASGFASHAEGCTTVARGNCSHAEGRYTTANGTYSHSSGVSSLASNNYSFVWSGALPPANPNDPNNKYGSNGEGTFNINPVGGASGFYIGETNLQTFINNAGTKNYNALENKPSINGQVLEGDISTTDWQVGFADTASFAYSADEASTAYFAYDADYATRSVTSVLISGPGDSTIGFFDIRLLTNNIANSGSYMFSEWSFTCDNAAAQEALNNNPPTMGKAFQFNRYAWEVSNVPSVPGFDKGNPFSSEAYDPDATNVTFYGFYEKYDDDWNLQTLTVYANRTKTQTTFTNEPYTTYSYITNAVGSLNVKKISDNVNTLWTYVYGETVWIAVTNYMRTVQGVSPSFQLWEVRDGNTNCVYWSAEEIDIRVGDKIDVAVSNVAHTIATQKADKAWSKYQSMTGEDNPQPNDITIVSTPSIMLSGGYEWQRFVDTGNEVWILKCNCPTMLGSSSVSNGVNTGSGYFRIIDTEGKTHFSVEKTDSKLVDAVPNSVSFSNDGNGYFQVAFQSNVKPSLYVSKDLTTPFIECLEDSENEYGLTCSWSEANGIYTATIMYNSAEGKPTKLFAYGKVMQEGSVVIKNTAAASFDGGIIIGGNKYTVGTAVIDGKTVLTLENGQAVSE